MPAGILISALCTQVSQGSLQPSTRNVHSPSLVARTDARPPVEAERASSGAIGTVVSLPSGSVRTTEALTASWPSRNTVARTGNASPTAALAG